LTLEAFGEEPSKERLKLLENGILMNLAIISCFIYDSVECKEKLSEIEAGTRYLQEILLLLCFVFQNSQLLTQAKEISEITRKIG
jgi:hypothetical protein